ncbi:hypothetical protein PITC_068470 [Penicillium italicum]|uniref:Zn(2)-C6 fungal-type domain-containing protein n=1 Tax=Penicillium italicum TaxID=40296 RepID=A0A0A2LEN9_PENIT|nr:hypothetical protein PITC_068470 [Penicillium italicum]
MPQTWQLSSTTAVEYETRPVDPDILKMVNEFNKDPIDSQPQELDIFSGPVSFDSIMTPPIIEDHQQSSPSLTSPESQHLTWPSSANGSLSCISTERDRSRSVHSSGESQPFAAPVRPPSPPLNELYPDGFVFWDPADPAKSDKIHEKVPRNAAELQQQREDIAALKKAGGSCMACYRAKKKCGTTTPCPPCLSKGNRICFRSWGDLCLLGPPTGGSFMIPGFPSQEAKYALQCMSQEAFSRMETFDAVVNIRETYGGNCSAWHWTVTRSSITLSSRTECPVDDFLSGVTSVLPLVDIFKLGDPYQHSSLVWTAVGIAKLFLAIQGLAQARIRTSWFETSAGRLVSFYLLILSFRKLAQVSQEFCSGLYVALCGKDKQNSNKKSRSRKENDIDPAWMAAALYYRVVCGLQDLQKHAAIARTFGPFSCYLSGVREKLEDILHNVSPRHGATGKSSCRAILEDAVPKLPSSPDVDMAFWLADPAEMSSSVLRRHDSPFSPPACDMQAFLADSFPRPGRMAHPVEQHNELLQSSATSHSTLIAPEQPAFDNMPFADQIETFDPNGLLNFLGNDYDHAFDPMAASFVDRMPLDAAMQPDTTMPPDTALPLYGNFQQSLYNC